MSNRFSPKFEPIRFDPSGVFTPETGLSRDDWVALFPQLEAARAAVLIEMQGGKLPLLTLPERMLDEYIQRRHESELGRILAAAKRMRDAVDRVIIIGDESATLGARALFEACCHPYHNEQGRGDRGGRPRINFISPYEDNDALHGLIDLLETERPAKTIDRRWGIVAIESACKASDSNPALNTLLPRYRTSCSGDAAAIAESLMFVAQRNVWLATQCQEISDRSMFMIPDGVIDSGDVFSTIGLLPASIMGIDVVRYLEGAAAMNQRLQVAPPGDNPPLDLAGAWFLCGGGPCGIWPTAAPRGMQLARQWCHASFQLHRSRREPNRRRQYPHRLFRLDVDVATARRDIVTQPESSPFLRLAPKRAPQTKLVMACADEVSLGQWMQMALLSREVEVRLAD
jgi:hypothetical protein